MCILFKLNIIYISNKLYQNIEYHCVFEILKNVKMAWHSMGGDYILSSEFYSQ